MPRAGDAFLTGGIPLTNNPLDRINFDPFTSVFDIEAFIEQLKKLITDYIIPIIKDLTGIDLSFLVQLFNGIDITSPGAILAAIVQAVIDVINRILAPFGTNDSFGSLTEALNMLVTTLMSPFTALTHLGEFVEDLFGQHDSAIAGLKAQINALRLSLDPAITNATGAYDDCGNADDFTELIGTLEPTGWGALDAHDRTVAHYNSYPKTNRHGAGIKVKSRKVGITRVHICSDDTMTNYAALELEVPVSGPDVVRVRTGTSPTDLVTRKSAEIRIPSETFWEIFYEPYDETSLTSNTFHVFSGGEPIIPLRWTDAGNIVTHPADPATDHPRVGITINGLDHDTRRGFVVTDFTWYDWQAAAPQ